MGILGGDFRLYGIYASIPMNIFIVANNYNSFNSYRLEHEIFMNLARIGRRATLMTNAEPEYRHLYEDAA